MFLLLGSFSVLPFSFAASPPLILPLKDQTQVIDRWLTLRLENVLPEIMRRENMDMWIVVCREYNEDPVYNTLVPAASFVTRRLTMLVSLIDIANFIVGAIHELPLNLFPMWLPVVFSNHASCLTNFEFGEAKGRGFAAESRIHFITYFSEENN